jgi:hypothetical protein
MQLTGRVTRIESASVFTDGLERITVTINEADAMFREFRIINMDGAQLNDDVQLLVQIEPKVKGVGK